MGYFNDPIFLTNVNPEFLHNCTTFAVKRFTIPFPPVREDRLARFIFKLIPFSNEGKRERREEKSEEGQTVEGKRAQFLSRNRSPVERKQVETERKVKIRTFRFIVRARREVNDS